MTSVNERHNNRNKVRGETSQDTDRLIGPRRRKFFPSLFPNADDNRAQSEPRTDLITVKSPAAVKVTVEVVEDQEDANQGNRRTSLTRSRSMGPPGSRRYRGPGSFEQMSEYRRSFGPWVIARGGDYDPFTGRAEMEPNPMTSSLPTAYPDVDIPSKRHFQTPVSPTAEPENRDNFWSGDNLPANAAIALEGNNASKRHFQTNAAQKDHINFERPEPEVRHQSRKMANDETGMEKKVSHRRHIKSCQESHFKATDRGIVVDSIDSEGNVIPEEGEAGKGVNKRPSVRIHPKTENTRDNIFARETIVVMQAPKGEQHVNPNGTSSSIGVTTNGHVDASVAHSRQHYPQPPSQHFQPMIHPQIQPQQQQRQAPPVTQQRQAPPATNEPSLPIPHRHKRKTEYTTSFKPFTKYMYDSREGKFVRIHGKDGRSSSSPDAMDSHSNSSNGGPHSMPDWLMACRERHDCATLYQQRSECGHPILGNDSLTDVYIRSQGMPRDRSLAALALATTRMRLVDLRSEKNGKDSSSNAKQVSRSVSGEDRRVMAF